MNEQQDTFRAGSHDQGQHDRRQDEHMGGLFAMNPMMGAWAGLWQRYIETSMRMMSIWMSLPSDMMASSRSGQPEERMRDSMRAYENAVAQSGSLASDMMSTTAAMGKEAGKSVKNRMAS